MTLIITCQVFVFIGNAAGTFGCMTLKINVGSLSCVWKGMAGNNDAKKHVRREKSDLFVLAEEGCTPTRYSYCKNGLRPYNTVIIMLFGGLQ